MKANFIINIISILIISTILISCNKFLEKKSDSSLVNPLTLNDLQGMLDDFQTMNSQTISFGEASADDYFILTTTFNSLPLLQQQAYTWSVTTNNFPNDWGAAYNAIYNANYCLEQVEEITQTVQNALQWRNVKGSALFFRAFNFLNLLWTYSKIYDDLNSQTDLGIVLRLNSDFNKPSLRANVKSSYEQIISDLKVANEFLPENQLFITRPSKVASYALLARTYLSMSKYDSAFKYADLSLQIKGNLLDYNSDLIVPTSTRPFPTFESNEEIIFYTTMHNGYPVKAPGTALIDTTLYDQFMDNDLRKSIFFRNSGSHKRFKGSYASSPTTLFSGIGVDEVYLIRAECNARMGAVAEAVNDLNTLLEKRWVAGTFIPIVGSNMEEVLEIILIERRKQLLMRGTRWIDIKRLNKEGMGIIPIRKIEAEVYTLEPNESRYALPLPKDVIDITGMQQN